MVPSAEEASADKSIILVGAGENVQLTPESAERHMPSCAAAASLVPSADEATQRQVKFVGVLAGFRVSPESADVNIPSSAAATNLVALVEHAMEFQAKTGALVFVHVEPQLVETEIGPVDRNSVRPLSTLHVGV